MGLTHQKRLALYTLYERLKAGKENRAQLSTIPQEETHRVHPISNVPTPLTRFIGREREVAEIVNLVGANRLVTLTGPGGVGKTRLAIQSSHKLMNKFIDGLWWVKLASLTDETLVPQVVARVLGVHEAPSENSIELIKRFLQQKQLLLVLDNCGHLLTACAQLTCELLAHCINLRILATSCEALDVTVETVYQVPTLSLPEMENLTLTKLLLEYEGVRLFVERASFIKFDFSLTEQNAAAVFQICRLLDGIPLALELAAVQISLLEVEQIADCINEFIYHISQETLTELPHHQVLQMLIDWSYELLSDKEKILFRRLAVFAGGFTLEDARSVGSGEGIEAERASDLLSCLVNKLLITRQEQNGDVRYSIQETIRQYVRVLQARVPNVSIRGY